SGLYPFFKSGWVSARPPQRESRACERGGTRLPGESGWDDARGRDTRTERHPARGARRASEAAPESGTRERHAPKTAKHASAPAPQKGAASAHKIGSVERLHANGYTPAAAFSPAILPYTMHIPAESPLREMGYCTAKRPPCVAPQTYRPGMTSRSVLYTRHSSSDSRPPKLPNVRAHPHSAA